MLTIAVSSRSLFQLEEANDIHVTRGQAAFDEYMFATENEPLKPGAAFPLVSKLLALNSTRSPQRRDRVEVVLLSRNSAGAGMRVMNSVHHHGLDIEQAVFTNGGDRFAYAHALEADLFLCSDSVEASRALKYGIAAANIVSSAPVCIADPTDPSACTEDLVVRIAFDGDSVLFSGEADQVYRDHGIMRFRNDELRDAGLPLGEGCFKHLLGKLHDLREALPPELAGRLRISLVTARGLPSHGRPLNTLRSWGLSVDEAIFCAGKPKGPLLRAFRADMFFDDTGRNVESARAHGVAAGHVLTEAGDGIVAAA